MTTRRTFTAGSAAKKLEAIHRRMADVTEEEALAAVLGGDAPKTFGATTTITLQFQASEGEVRSGFALTRTA